MLEKIKNFYYGMVSIVLLLINTAIVAVPIVSLSLLKLLIPIKSLQFFLGSILEFFARIWVSLNIFAVKLISPTEIIFEQDEKLKKDGSYLVICNHKSWLDTLLLQLVFHKKIAFPKFFMKYQMIYVPFIGLACWALDFPVMRRYSKEYLEKNPEKKGEDIRRTKEYCEKMPKRPTTIINFVEGTRYTLQKAKKSKYKNLLNPKAGGIAVILEALSGRLDGILNTIIIYESSKETLWRFMTRQTKRIRIKMEFIPLPKIPLKDYFGNEQDKEEFQQWLNKLWQRNDEYITVATEKITYDRR